MAKKKIVQEEENHVEEVESKITSVEFADVATLKEKLNEIIAYLNR